MCYSCNAKTTLTDLILAYADHQEPFMFSRHSSEVIMCEILNETIPVVVTLTATCLACCLPASATPDIRCIEEISSVGSTLVNTYGVVLRDVRREPTMHPRNPFPGSQTLFISLLTQYNQKIQSAYERRHTQMADNLLNSPALMVRLSRQIMDACPGISIVNMHRAGSGDSNPIFRMPSGIVKPGVWIDTCGRGLIEIKYEWGFYEAC
jgi:hypothetical protein